jgi:hypothetical protein
LNYFARWDQGQKAARDHVGRLALTVGQGKTKADAEIEAFLF